MLELFFSYSHQDEALRDELEVHLAMLKRQNVISTWHDRRIVAGEDFGSKIDDQLERADIVLLLVSPYFLASDYCYDIEMKRALDRHGAGDARVIPVILHPCDWHDAPFGSLRATPLDGKPVSKFANQHEAFLAVTRDIRQAVEELVRAKGGRAAAPAANVQVQPMQGAYDSMEPRSSNLRVRREFTDHDRARFLVHAFEYTANYFENSLKELELRAPGITTDYRRVDANRFTAGVFRGGRHVNSCTVWISDDRSSRGEGEVRFSYGSSSLSNSYNESLSVADDGYTLGLRALGLQTGGSRDDILSLEGGAEQYWSMLLAQLQ
jgi:hypothetical protein